MAVQERVFDSPGLVNHMRVKYNKSKTKPRKSKQECDKKKRKDSLGGKTQQRQGLEYWEPSVPIVTRLPRVPRVCNILKASIVPKVCVLGYLGSPESPKFFGFLRSLRSLRSSKFLGLPEFIWFLNSSVYKCIPLVKPVLTSVYAGSYAVHMQ